MKDHIQIKKHKLVINVKEKHVEYQSKEFNVKTKPLQKNRKNECEIQFHYHHQFLTTKNVSVGTSA